MSVPKLPEGLAEFGGVTARQAESDGATLAGCPAIGVGGVHSEGYGDPDDGVCQWCGQRSREETGQ